MILWLRNKITGFLTGIFIILVSVIAFTGFFHKTFSSQLSATMKDYEYYSWLVLSMLMISLFIFCLFKWIQQAGSKQLLILRLAIWLLSIGIIAVVIIMFRIVPITDSWTVLDLARYFAENPDKVMDSANPYFKYFGKYSNNYFITIMMTGVFRIIKGFSAETQYFILYGANGVLLLLGNWFAYASVKHISGEKAATKVLVLLGMNPVTYILVLWFYTCSISVPFMTGIIYLCTKISNETGIRKNAVRGFLVGVSAMLAYLIRPTSFFPILAVCVVICLRFIPTKKALTGLAITLACCCIGMLLVLIPVKKLSNHYFSEAIDANFPVTHWIMMGSHDNGIYCAEDEIYTYSQATKEEKTKANVEKIKENYLQNGIAGTISLWISKMELTFGEGYSEGDVRAGTDTRFSRLYSLMAGNQRDLLFYYATAFRFVILLMIASSFISKTRNGTEFHFLDLISVVTLLGGFLFYCLWEAKAVYSAPFIPVMLMLAGDLQVTVPERIKSYKSKKYIRYFALTAWVLFLIMGYRLLCCQEINKVRYTVKGYGIQQNLSFEDKISEFMQSFYSNGKFDTIDLWANVNNSESEDASEYLLEVLDFDQNVLGEITFSVNDFSNQKCHLVLEKKINPPRGELMYIRIRQVKHGNKSASFIHRITLGGEDGTYSGTLLADGEEQNCDLFMSVYENVTGPFMSMKWYVICWAMLTAIAFGLYMYVVKGTEMK